jgi:hypothetical protein
MKISKFGHARGTINASTTRPTNSNDDGKHQLTIFTA